MDLIVEEKKRLRRAGLETSPQLQAYESKATKLGEKKNGLLQEIEVLKSQAKQKLDLVSLLSDLEGLKANWPKRKFNARLNMVEALIETVFLDPAAPRLYKVEIIWKFPEWGIDTGYVLKGGTSSIPWTPEEDALLKSKLGTPEGTVEKFSALFPTRSLEGIRQRAQFLTGSASIPGEKVNRRVASFSRCDLDLVREEDLCLDTLLLNDVFWKGEAHNCGDR